MKRAHFAPDIAAFIDLLEAYEVRYLLIGGEAVIYHGYPRLTGDVDLAFAQDPTNVRRLWAALVEFWDGDVPALNAANELLEPGVLIQYGRPPNRLDLIAEPAGLDFDEAWTRRISEPLEGSDQPGRVYIIGLADLLQTKRAAGRHKDLADVEALEGLAEPSES